MERKLTIILAVLVTFTLVSVVIVFVLDFTQDRMNKSDEPRIENFTVVSRSYTDSTGILTIDLQNVGGSLDSIIKEDFTWHMNGNAGSASSITVPNGESTDIEKGDIIQVTLKIGKNASGAKIELTFRGGPHFVITIP